MFLRVKKKMSSGLTRWLLVFFSVYVIQFDILQAVSDSKASSNNNMEDKSKLLSSDKNVYRKIDKNLKAGEDDNDISVKGAGDFIPIPDHLLNTDYDHHYAYEDGNMEGYEDYEDEYHSNIGKIQKYLFSKLL